jgi:apolipoprotein N-acyltransferase
MEEKIVENKEKNQKGKPKAKDSLDELRNEHEIGRSKAKTQRAESAYSNTATSVGSNSRVLSYYNKVPELSPITEVKPVTIEK